jgi:hypothetical protein
MTTTRFLSGGTTRGSVLALTLLAATLGACAAGRPYEGTGEGQGGSTPSSTPAPGPDPYHYRMPYQAD